MSTTFGILKDGCKNDRDEDNYIKIAHRAGIGKDKVGITWLNESHDVLSNDTKVHPLDNSAQGVETMGDLRRLHLYGK